MAKCSLDKTVYERVSPMEISNGTSYLHQPRDANSESLLDFTHGIPESTVLSGISGLDAEGGQDETSDLIPNIPVGCVRPTWHNVLSFSFLTLSVLSATLFTFVPFVLFTYKILFELTDRWYFSFPIAFLRFFDISCTLFALCRANSLVDITASCCFSGKENFWSSLAVCQVIFWSIISVCLHGFFVPSLFEHFRDSFFHEPDGTMAVEWHDLEKTFLTATIWSCSAALVDFLVAAAGLGLFYIGSERGLKWNQSRSFLHRLWLQEYSFNLIESKMMHSVYHGIVSVSLIMTLILLGVCGMSSHTYLFVREPPAGSALGPFCDPLDKTECLMPFPSSFFTREDASTVTKRRVDISPEALSSMYKGDHPIQPSFLNELDGFSTLGPILFYLDGVKESGGLGINGSKLPGPEEINLSTTSKSTTLLVDVSDRILVPHFADIDFMDPKRPSIVMQPAVPLKHNSTFAVALINCVGADGRVLPPSSGLLHLLGNKSNALNATDRDKARSSHFKNYLIPALREVAPWVGAIQMLFDFHTVSAESQLGLPRRVRDGALSQVKRAKWGGWGNHNVRVIKIIDKPCRCPNDRIARVVHGELDVPWFLNVRKPRHRASSFNLDSVLSRETTHTMPVKFIVIVPCSLVNETNSMNLTAIVDYGHGFLYSRKEVLDSEFLHRLSDINGWLLVASNWRGMSELDVPVVLRTFVAKPNLFQALRDNLIQGFADKAVIQHFCQNGLLGMEFLKFNNQQPSIRFGSDSPRYIFYGISQGGILGAAYASLMGPALIDRSILGSPGTPFALLMSRSDIFPFYRTLLLLHLYHLRHVRIVISLMQMAWDSVEAAGVLAPPITEPYPPTLIQTGFGDSMVTTIGAEIMARAFCAARLPGNPKEVFGLPLEIAANASWGGPSSALSELLYKKENASLPAVNVGVKHNKVHWCTRNDADLQSQLVEFVNTGRIIDPCIKDGCVRANATC